MSLIDLLRAWADTLDEDEYATLDEYLRDMPPPRPVLDVPTRGLL